VSRMPGYEHDVFCTVPGEALCGLPPDDVISSCSQVRVILSTLPMGNITTLFFFNVAAMVGESISAQRYILLSFFYGLFL
jgi:hypothetical protein